MVGLVGMGDVMSRLDRHAGPVPLGLDRDPRGVLLLEVTRRLEVGDHLDTRQHGSVTHLRPPPGHQGYGAGRRLRIFIPCRVRALRYTRAQPPGRRWNDMPADTPALVERDRFALVVIDVQERLATAMPRRAEVVSNAIALAKVAALVGAPIIVTRQYPKGLGGTVSDLEEAIVPLAAHGAHVQGIDKTAFCCAAEPEFVRALKATGRDQAVICGMETHICIAQTALALAAGGHAVQVVADACCSIHDADHAIALERMRARGVDVTVAQSVMYEAVGAAGTDEFKSLLAIVKGEQ
ncbi:MAG: hypothetical protein C0418_00990 [Coriobacteriaceae bacterium]|nr:hypothetical protein [Coriobacteriaceae bacterium]